MTRQRLTPACATSLTFGTVRDHPSRVQLLAVGEFDADGASASNQDSLDFGVHSYPRYSVVLPAASPDAAADFLAHF